MAGLEGLIDDRPDALKATWSAAYINDLADSCFLYIEPGGEKDEEAKTTPRSKRHFPYKDSDGKVDLPHLRNAIARIPQSNAPGLDDAKKQALQEKARGILERTSKSVDLEAQPRLVREAFYAQFQRMPEMRPQPSLAADWYVERILDNRLIVNGGAEGYYSIPYTIEDDKVTFGEPQRVEIEYKPAKALEAGTLVMFGGAVKALGDGKVGGYLVRFSDDESPDLEGEFFDAATDYGIVRDSLAFYNHGLDARLRGKTLGDPAELGKDEVGIWIKHQLDLRNKWERAVYGLAEKGKLSWSSGTAPHLVEREAAGKAVHIKRWLLGLDASYTPTPAEPRNVALPLKSWAEMAPLLEVEPQEAVSKTASATTTEGTVTVNVNLYQKPVKEAITEVTTMSENVETPQVQAPAVDMSALAGVLAAAVKDGIAEATKALNEAWEQRLAAEPAINSAGYLTVHDAADRALQGNPYKSFGEFLLDVANAATLGQANERLLPLKSKDPLNESGYSVGGAMGLKFIGSLYGAAVNSRRGLKAVATTGMSEGYAPSAGFLVGTDEQAGILSRVYAVGDLLQRVAMMQVSAASNSMTFNAEDETSRAAGYRRGGIQAYWVAEGGTPTTSRPSFRKVELKLKKVAAICYATDELLADATALESWIMQYLPEELRFVVEDAIMNGTGGGMPLGLVNSGAVVSVAKETGQAAATFTAQNVIKMWARRWGRATDYVWFVNQDVTPQLLQLSLAVGTGGQILYMPPGGLSATPYGSLLGRPVIESEYCQTLGTTGDAWLVAPSQYQMIEKGGIESASSIHVNFVTAETCFRFIYRCDGRPTWNSALTPAHGSNTISPYVKLDAR